MRDKTGDYTPNNAYTDSNSYFDGSSHGIRLPTTWMERKKQTNTKSTIVLQYAVIIYSCIYIYVIPSENMILRNTPNAEMQNMSSKLHAAITSVMIPLSSPRPFCLNSNSAGRITAELTGLKMLLWAEELSGLTEQIFCWQKLTWQIKMLKNSSQQSRVYLRVHSYTNNISARQYLGIILYKRAYFTQVIVPRPTAVQVGSA